MSILIRLGRSFAGDWDGDGPSWRALRWYLWHNNRLARYVEDIRRRELRRKVEVMWFLEASGVPMAQAHSLAFGWRLDR